MLPKIRFLVYTVKGGILIAPVDSVQSKVKFPPNIWMQMWPLDPLKLVNTITFPSPKYNTHEKKKKSCLTSWLNLKVMCCYLQLMQCKLVSYTRSQTWLWCIFTTNINWHKQKLHGLYIKSHFLRWCIHHTQTKNISG